MTRRFLLPLALTALAACSSDPSDTPDECTTSGDCPASAPLCVDGSCTSEGAGDATDDAADAADAGEDVADDTADTAPDTADATPDTGEEDAGDATEEVTEDVVDEEVVEYPPLAFVTNPEDGATFVALDAVVEVRFNQPMNALRFIPSNIRLSETHNDPLERVITYDPDTYTLSVSPPEEDGLLRPVTPYEFRLADVIASVSGESIGDPFRMEFSTTGYPGRVFLRQLAEAYAPVVYQQVEDQALDTFARIDFDGNLIPSDNLENADEPNYGFIYYDVIESVSHYFITYMLYYPGSVPREGVTYEHDIVSLQVVVRKDPTDPLGELRAFSTFYHENLNTWAIENSWYDEGDNVDDNDEDIEARLTTEYLVDDRHVSIFIESGRHAVCLPNASTLAGPCAPDDGETAPFEPETVGLIYGVAEAATRIGDGPNNALTYSLRSFVEEFWALRNRVDGDDAVFGGEFAYRPPVINEETEETRPGAGEYFPTALNADNADGQWGDLPFIVNVSRERTDQGVWYVDPAWANNAMFAFPESFSPDYCFNPYLDIDVRDETRGCTPSDFVLGGEGSGEGAE